jgi:O-antigen ligase
MNTSRTYTNFIATLGRMIVVLYAFTHMNSMEGIRKVINAFLVAVVLNNLFILAVFGPSALTEVRTSGVVTQAGNNNSIGMSSAYAIILYWYLGNERRRKKPFMILIYAFLMLIVLLTGSKKALLILFLAVAIMYFLMHKNKLTVVLVIAVVVAVGYFLLLNVPFLYSLIGNRIQSMVHGIISMLQLENLTADNLINTSLNKSDRTRFYMILRGLEWAKERPLLGYGMANYQDLFGTVASKNMYSHNNYIEIWVGLGIVGLCWYYSLYAKIILGTWRHARRDANIAVALMLILLLMILELGLVSYLELYSYLTIAIAFNLMINKNDLLREEGV